MHLRAPVWVMRYLVPPSPTRGKSGEGGDADGWRNPIQGSIQTHLHQLKTLLDSPEFSPSSSLSFPFFTPNISTKDLESGTGAPIHNIGHKNLTEAWRPRSSRKLPPSLIIISIPVEGRLKIPFYPRLCWRLSHRRNS